MTGRQRQRQGSRSGDGRYAEHMPCYRCGKSAGEDYCSGPLVDRTDERGRSWGDAMLCLCEPCASYLDDLIKKPNGLDRIYAEVDGPRWGVGKYNPNSFAGGLPQGKAE
jgi:hypothetical protein